mmetsp:Transcript_2751/g.4433  ORF Transcript_2751/g.4433 Transcript_2751/m.4433 type:complete len:265 (+) Transcript_2751:3-797(+)
MMFQARKIKSQPPLPPRPMEHQEGVFASDSGMMFEARQPKSQPPSPPRPMEHQEGVFSSDSGMMFEASNLSPGRVVLLPSRAEASETTGQSFASFSSDGGIQLQTQMMEKPIVKSSSLMISQNQIEAAVADDRMSFSFDDANKSKRLFIPPKVAEASETRGQTFAAFASDGGIQMVARTSPHNLIMTPALTPLIQILVDKEAAYFDSNGLHFVQQRPSQPRLFLNPKLAEEIETVGQSFAAFQSDGGIQMLAQTMSKKLDLVKA